MRPPGTSYGRHQDSDGPRPTVRFQIPFTGEDGHGLLLFPEQRNASNRFTSERGNFPSWELQRKPDGWAAPDRYRAVTRHLRGWAIEVDRVYALQSGVLVQSDVTQPHDLVYLGSGTRFTLLIDVVENEWTQSLRAAAAPPDLPAPPPEKGEPHPVVDVGVWWPWDDFQRPVSRLICPLRSSVSPTTPHAVYRGP